MSIARQAVRVGVCHTLYELLRRWVVCAERCKLRQSVEQVEQMGYRRLSAPEGFESLNYVFKNLEKYNLEIDCV